MYLIEFILILLYTVIDISPLILLTYAGPVTNSDF